MTEMRRSSARIEDARGNRVRQLDPVRMHLLRQHAAIPAEPLGRIALEIDRKWTTRGYYICLVYVLGFLGCCASAVYYKSLISLNAAWDPVGISFLLLQFTFMLGCFLISWWIGGRARRRRTLWVMLKHRRCPQCGYDLRGLSVDAQDRATVCPECGSAWRLDDPAATEPAPPDLQATARRGRKIALAATLLLLVGAAVGLTMTAWSRQAKRNPIARQQAVAVQQGAEQTSTDGTGAGNASVAAPSTPKDQTTTAGPVP